MDKPHGDDYLWYLNMFSNFMIDMVWLHGRPDGTLDAF